MTGVPKFTGSCDGPRVATISKRIKELLDERGIGKNELDRRCGFSQGYSSRLARSLRNDPRAATLEILAAALETSFEYLARGAGPKQVVGVPVHWGWQPFDVARRALFARGVAVDVIEDAANRVLSAYGDPATLANPVPKMGEALTAANWLEELQLEIEQPGARTGDILSMRPPERVIEQQLLELGDRLVKLESEAVAFLTISVAGMREFRELPDAAQRAVMGLVFVSRQPLEVVLGAAKEVVKRVSNPKDIDADGWFAMIRRKVPDRPTSGTHPVFKAAKLDD